jgi:chromosome segregation ATPase
MGSLVEELKRREAAARAEADRLRSRIEELAEELARAEEQVSRLVIAREEVARVLEEPAVAEPSAGEPAGEPRPTSPIGAVTVPPWQEGTGASVLPRSYQDLLEAAADAGRPLRAAEFAAAAGLATGKAKVESLRSKLKLLAARGWLAAEPGGLFTLPDHAGKTAEPGR